MPRREETLQYMITRDAQGKTKLPMWIQVKLGLASPITIKMLVANNTTASTLAAHTYYATKLDRHRNWAQLLKVFADNDPNGVDFTEGYMGGSAGEAFGEAEVPVSFPATKDLVKVKFLLVGNPLKKSSPICDAQELRDEPVMGVLGMDFLSKYVETHAFRGVAGHPELGNTHFKLAGLPPRFCAWCLDASPNKGKAKCGGSCRGRAVYCRTKGCQKKDWKAYHSFSCSRATSNSASGASPAVYPW